MNALKLTFCATVAGLSMSACTNGNVSAAGRDAAAKVAATGWAIPTNAAVDAHAVPVTRETYRASEQLSI